MKRTPQERLRRECAKVVLTFAAKHIGNGEEAGDAGAIPRAAFKRPSDYDFVADVAIDRASGGKHRVGNIEEDQIEEAVKILIAEPLGMPRRVMEIEKHHDPLLRSRPPVASGEQ